MRSRPRDELPKVFYGATGVPLFRCLWFCASQPRFALMRFLFPGDASSVFVRYLPDSASVEVGGGGDG